MMPYAALRPCTYPGCSELVQRGRCARHPYEDAHEHESQRLYNTRAWKRRRAAQLRKEPWCAECLRANVYTPATEADHVVPHRGDPVKFFTGKLQSMCKACHSGKTAKEVGIVEGGQNVSLGGRRACVANDAKKTPRSKLQKGDPCLRQ